MKFSFFMMPLHHPSENPALAFDRDISLIHYADALDFDEFFIGEHHSGGWETMPPREWAPPKAPPLPPPIALAPPLFGFPFLIPFWLAFRFIIRFRSPSGWPFSITSRVAASSWAWVHAIWSPTKNFSA